ncbi:response regulator transcription factor [Rhodocytophaga aerolata]|uniref:Response regulator transcription factor n=1 Tax=Rhodocytophaga aerolata TaxID=455078 RepID=A0ABT8RDL7_9BACT|nr:response regulator transcription factor [Rhodocytophaga aerolata]MDO1449333.1 response regulator transcription factor [Rhodocytophaga aerolata]
MEALKILLIEDEASLVTMIQRGLTHEGYQVSAAMDGHSGLKLAINYEFDLILLDLMLPGMAGLELCRNIRVKNSQVPILILTALSTPENIVTGLDTGADDYLVKPFNFDVLNARIRTLIRRNRGIAAHHIIKIADLAIDLAAKSVTRNNQPITLTSTEFRLLEFMATNRKRVLSRIEILEHVWDINFDLGTNVVDVYINYLRKKLDKDFEPKLIQTVFGMGYMLKEP